MFARVKAYATALLLTSVMMLDSAWAGFFQVRPRPPASVPEFDGAGSITVIALLASVGAVLYSRSKAK